jgi:Flp pilus assembly CpaF family ATPase
MSSDASTPEPASSNGRASHNGVATIEVPESVVGIVENEKMKAAASAVQSALDATISQDEKLNREVFFSLLGPIKKYLENEAITNIEINEDGILFVDEFKKGKYETADRFPREKRIALISYLANREFGRSMDSLHSELQCDLPIWGCRVQAFALPISDWPLIIRVHAKHAFNLRGYVDKDEMSEKHYDYILDAINQELNIAVAGSVNSGKTTLMNSMLAEKAKMHPEARGVIVQDRREVRADDFKNKIYLMARVDQAHNEATGQLSRYTYDFSNALESALRCNQDFLVWGEVRDDRSAFGLTMATNTGTKGLMMTIHANSGRLVPRRMEQLIELNGKRPVREMIAETVQVAVYMERNRLTGKRRLTEVIRFHGVDEENNYEYEVIPA